VVSLLRVRRAALQQRELPILWATLPIDEITAHHQ
jgi:hypothetical protein